MIPSRCARHSRLVSLYLMIFFSATQFSAAHEEGEHAAGQNGAVKQTAATAIILPALEGPTPWSDKPLLNDPARFQIAIMTDRTGGHRPGVWMQAVNRVNLLRPEFVVSVGDLIEGYTEDRQQVEAEWKEFQRFIDKMDMRFFFVAGNHDLSNPMMHALWRETFGPEWFSFDYKDVHFVCLNSEDPVSQLGSEQLEWLSADLARHDDARWTLLFIHKPLWVYAEREIAAGNQDATGWKQAERLLGNRPHTVFSGHHHAYVQYDRNGTKYYRLATTGGGSRLRGKAYGEFDHIVWLTMEPDGPHVSNILLSGILPADVVTEQGIARFGRFLAETQVEVVPILVDDSDGFSSGRVDLRFTNRFDQPITLSGQFSGLPIRGLTLQPEQLTLRAEPGKSSTQAVDLHFAERISFAQLAGTTFTAQLRSEGESPSLAAEKVLPVVIDQRHGIPQLGSAVEVDGDLTEWGALRFRTPDEPLVLGQADLWVGRGDAAVDFDLRRDAERLYIAAQVTDDVTLPKEDQLELRLDLRPITARYADSRLVDGSYRLLVAPPTGDSTADIDVRDHQDQPGDWGIQAVTRRNEQGYATEIALPLSMVRERQGADWQSLQMAVAARDVDETGQDAARVLWRGTADFDRRNVNYGHFAPSDRP